MLKDSIPATLITGVAVFSCIASRNKRTAWHAKDGNLNPKQVGRPGGTATLNAKRRVAGLPGRKSSAPAPLSILLGSGCALRGWAEGPARRPGGSSNRKSTAHSSATCLQSPPAESSNERRRVAVRRVGWRRTARLCESQKLGSKHRPVSASLRLRFRSAAFCRRPPKEGFLRRDKFFARLHDSFYFGSPPK